ncbi:MAG: hypothetical protein ACOCUT_01885 [bacterium]
MYKEDKSLPDSNRYLFQEFPHPQIILNLPGMDNVLKNTVSDITLESEIVNSYLIIHKIQGKITADEFLNIILKNPVFNSKGLIIAAQKILKISKKSRKVLENIVSLSFRYLYSASFNEYIDEAFQFNFEVDPFLESYIIKGIQNQKLFSEDIEEIKYIGELQIPDNTRIITNLEDLLRIKYQIENYSENEWKRRLDIDGIWENMVNKESYVLCSKVPEPLIFIVNQNPYMQWFEIENVVSSDSYEVPEIIIQNMASQIVKPENQFFFNKNYFEEFPILNCRNPSVNRNLNRHLFQASKDFLDEVKKIDRIIEIHELKIINNENKSDLFHIKNSYITEKNYNQIKINIQNKFLELEANPHYLLSKIESEDLLTELIRRKYDNLYNYWIYRLNYEFYKKSSLKNIGDAIDPGDPYAAIFKDMLLKLNMSDLTKANHEAGVTALLVKINQKIQTMTMEEIFESIPSEDLIKKNLENKGWFIKTKDEQKGYSLFKFLCDRLGVNYFTEKETLLGLINDRFYDPAF